MSTTPLSLPTAAARSRRRGRALERLGLYAVLCLGAFVLSLPLFWLVSSSLKPTAIIFTIPPRWIPNPVVWQNYPEAWNAIPFALFVRNSLTVTGFSVLGSLLSASLVAYGFARLRFPLRDQWFMVLLATIMVPPQVTLIPTYILFKYLGWLNSFYPLVVPWFLGGGAFNVFLLRQFYMTLPLELDDAGRIDGCSTFRIYTSIVLPQSRPAIGVIAILGFLAHWNDFFNPLIYLNSTSKFTLALGLHLFRESTTTGVATYVPWNRLMAASVMAALPCIVLYFTAQRYFIQGIVFTGLKG